MRRRTISAAALAAVAATTVTACGSSSGSSGAKGNGITAKPAARIVTTAIDAAEAAKSMHVAGTINQNGQRVALDLDLAPTGAAGSITQGSQQFDLVDTGGEVYIKGNRAFLRNATGSSSGVQLLLGKWLKGSATGQLAGISGLTTIKGLMGAVATGHGKLTKGTQSTVAGRQVIGINDTTKGGTLYVATSGQPYPIRITNGGTTSGAVTFSRFGATLPIAAPKGAIDLDALSKSGG